MNDYRTIKYIIKHLDVHSLFHASDVNTLWKRCVMKRVSRSEWESTWLNLQKFQIYPYFDDNNYRKLFTVVCPHKGIQFLVLMLKNGILIQFSSVFAPNLKLMHLTIPFPGLGERMLLHNFTDAHVVQIPSSFSILDKTQHLLIITLQFCTQCIKFVVDYTHFPQFTDRTFIFDPDELEKILYSPFLNCLHLIPLRGIEKHFLKVKWNHQTHTTLFPANPTHKRLTKTICIREKQWGKPESTDQINVYHGGELLQSYQFSKNNLSIEYLATFYDTYLLFYNQDLNEDISYLVDMTSNKILQEFPQIRFHVQIELGYPYILLIYNDSSETWETKTLIVNCKTNQFQHVEGAFNSLCSVVEPDANIKKKQINLKVFDKISKNFLKIKYCLLV